MKVIDLFCGCGGFSLGFDYAGFKVVLGLDKWEVACQSYSVNFPDAEVICEDALNVDPASLPRADIVIGSPPCQNFSVANLKKNPASDEPLIRWFWDVVFEINPKYVIMEEVPMARKFLPPDIPVVRIYRMCDYGVPQIRKRLFAGRFVEPAKHPTDIIFPAVMASEWKGSAGPRQMTRLSWAFGRKSLIPEAKLIQTFPLDYYLAGSLKEQYIQIGNAVPPLMSYRLAEAIRMKEEGLGRLDLMDMVR